jgi:hypothetical protein
MGSIKYFAEKIKPLFAPVAIISMCLLFFGLGRLSALEINKSPVSVVKRASGGDILSTETMAGQQKTLDSVDVPVNTESSEVIAAKTGTKYYLPWCGALKRIKPENRVVFATVALARQAGYTPAANCKGVK